MLGPSNLRDAVGFGLGVVLDPLNFAGGSAVTDFSYARMGASAIDGRAEYLPVTEEIERTALDPYATYRSLYRQHRAAQIRDASAPVGRVDIKLPADTAPGDAAPGDAAPAQAPAVAP